MQIVRTIKRQQLCKHKVGDRMPFYIILIINTLFTFGISATRPIVSIYSTTLGYYSFTLGILIASYSFLSMLLAARTGRWVDHLGARKMAFCGALGVFLALLLPWLIPNLFFLFLSQIIMGISQLFIVLSIQKTVGNMNGDREKLIATHSLSGAIGDMLGPLASGYIYAHFGFQVTFGVAMSAVLLGILMSFLLKSSDWKSGEPIKQSGVPLQQESVWRLLRDTNLRNAILISGVVLYSRELITAYFPLYGSNIGMTSSEIGIVLSLSASMSLVVRLLQYRLVKMIGRSRVMSGTVLLSAFTFLFVFLTDIPLLLAIIFAFMGAFLGMGQPLSMVYAMDLSPVERHGEILGLRLSINRVLQFVAPIIFGGIGGVFGVGSIFLVNSFILFISSRFIRIDPAITGPIFPRKANDGA